ncbi:alpha/beta hydrolase [Brachybacterium aquaticum]|uniref:Acetyl esterase n=1 Tax=Brachybacterium aquaticum TaxID=1432564 RepID=A0A841AIK2_9MICO|nr:alpha/beta hydrolase [Brachybacterium aquaticum]MBB5833145.1 acetyl esterase [Brachybacterium aquaticum]
MQGRRQIDIEAWQFGGRPAPIGLMQDLLIPGADGPIPARLYRPLGSPGTVGGSSGSSRRSSSGSRESARPVPLTVYYHGGGFVLGSITSHDPICRFLAHRAGVAVLSIGYRLAPEHPFPAGHEDAIAAYAWAAAHTETLGLAPHLAVVGDSAGGNLAAAVSLAARDRGLPMTAGQVLISRWLDLTSSAPSRTQSAKGFFLTTAQLDWYADHPLPDPDLATDPRVSPLRAPDLSGLPPTVLSFAGFEPLRDDSLAAAARQGEAGVPMTTHLQEGHIHAFSNVLGAGRTGLRAAGEIAEMLAGLLAAR